MTDKLENVDRELLEALRDEVAAGDLPVKELAFQLWALRCDRSPKRVEQMLRSEFGIEDIGAALISKWASRGQWAEQQRQLLEQSAPDLMTRTVSLLVGGAHDAARYLVDAAAGRDEADRVRVVAAVAVLDRVGLLPFTRRDAERGASPLAHGLQEGNDMAPLSRDELQAIVAGRASSVGVGVIDG